MPACPGFVLFPAVEHERRRQVTMSSRPDRSDAHLPPEQEAKVEAEAREYFEAVAPKRHTKPSRSDYSAVYADSFNQLDGENSIPELQRFQDLQSNDQKLVCEGREVEEDYVETEYYADLICIDKQHHTTGSGFIKVDRAGSGSDFELTPAACVCDASGCHVYLKGNPATNEWIPSADNTVNIPESHKPMRSDL